MQDSNVVLLIVAVASAVASVNLDRPSAAIAKFFARFDPDRGHEDGPPSSCRH